MKTVLLLCLVFLVLGACSQNKNIKLTEAEINDKVGSLISQMTLEEKIDMLSGEDEFVFRPLKRLGIPQIKTSDGPAGVGNYIPNPKKSDGSSNGGKICKSTAYPDEITLAASWDTAMVREFGKSIGIEARAKGIHIMLCPAMNIYRAPMCGRNFEYLGEDPYLAGQMASSIIRGIQSQNVCATAKHFACNNQEYNRTGISSDVEERTLQEIYFPAFKACVDAKVGSVMDSYNLLNGIYTSQNDYLLNQVLKKDWGFEGFVMSDWGSTHDGVAAALAGQDLEMPQGSNMNRNTLIPAIKAGKLSEELINDKVRRILKTYFRFGFMDKSWDISGRPVNTMALANVALRAAREGITLLKNQQGILPFQKQNLKSIAVIGPNAHPAITGGGGSGYIEAYHEVSVLQGIKNIVGNEIKVNYCAGLSSKIPDKFYENSIFLNPRGKGLKAEFFSNRKLDGKPVFTGIDEHIDIKWPDSIAPGLTKRNFSARWQGKIIVQKTAEYRFNVGGDGGYRLFIDGKPMANSWKDRGEVGSEQFVMSLVAGKEYDVRLECYLSGYYGKTIFGYDEFNAIAFNNAVNAAAKSDVAVVCVGFDQFSEGEGFDRTFNLPLKQAELIEKVAEVNKNTVVVIFAGGNVNMAGWYDKVSGLIHAFYPGQEGGTAIAEILFGKVNPSGKLPVTFEKRWEDNPTFNSYYDDNNDNRVSYMEGIFVGYRGYDKSGIEPMFPFGFGLSYTTFAYSNLKLSKPEMKNDDMMTVSVDIANTGKVDGKEVVQLYIHDIQSSLPRPLKELKNFTKVSLKTGETKTVKFTITNKDLMYFNPDKHNWMAEPGEFEALIGASSKDIRLKQNFVLNK